MTEQYIRELVAYYATTLVGIKEGTADHTALVNTYNSISPLPVGYKLSESDPWCAAFVSVVFWNVIGHRLNFPYECSCERMRLGASKLGIWVEDDGYMPKVGDIVMYDWQDSGDGDNTGYPDHVGIVTETWTDTFKAVEGNLHDSVDTRILHKDNKFIRGFITPNYSSICDSEDELSDAQKWFRDTFHITIGDYEWDDRVAVTYRQLADILYALK